MPTATDPTGDPTTSNQSDLIASIPVSIAHILDAGAHSSRRQAAADLHAARKDGAYTGGRPDNDQSLLAFAASAAGMEYRPEVSPETASIADVNFKVPGKIKNGDRKPVTEKGVWFAVVAAAPKGSAKQMQDAVPVNLPSYRHLNDSARRRAEMRAIREAE